MKCWRITGHNPHPLDWPMLFALVAVVGGIVWACVEWIMP
jgi:hypothetical protein